MTEGQRGCFLMVALLAVVIVVFYLFTQGARGVFKEFDRNPGGVIGFIAMVGVVSFLIYYLTKSKN